MALAVDNGMKIELVDKVFGMAGGLAQKVSSDLPENVVPKKSSAESLVANGL